MPTMKAHVYAEWRMECQLCNYVQFFSTRKDAETERKDHVATNSHRIRMRDIRRGRDDDPRD